VDDGVDSELVEADIGNVEWLSEGVICGVAGVFDETLMGVKLWDWLELSVWSLGKLIVYG
jgi:hypothetical protein